MNKETMQYTIMQYLNKLIKVELAQNKEVPYIHGTYIGIFQYDEKKYYICIRDWISRAAGLR